MANLLTLVDGRKGPSDVLVLLRCDDEPLTFSELLYILQKYFDSEDGYYPTKEGFMGKKYLLEAIYAVYDGASIAEVCKRFKLELKLNVVDMRRSHVQPKAHVQTKTITRLEEILL